MRLTIACSRTRQSRAADAGVRQKMRILFITLSHLFVLLTPVHAIFSEFVVLDSDSYVGNHAEYRPSLKVNSKNPNFVDVRIPFHKGGQSYWLIIASKELPEKELEFRLMTWDGKVYDGIESFVRLGESMDLWGVDPKGKGYLEFTVHKDILQRCYVYHDYDAPVDDGGFYYTYNLPKHRVEQDAAPQIRPR